MTATFCIFYNIEKKSTKYYNRLQMQHVRNFAEISFAAILDLFSCEALR